MVKQCKSVGIVEISGGSNYFTLCIGANHSSLRMVVIKNVTAIVGAGA